MVERNVFMSAIKLLSIYIMQGWNSIKLKDLTGGDTISVRRLFKDYFEFHPEFKLWMYANFKPKVKAAFSLCS